MANKYQLEELEKHEYKFFKKELLNRLRSYSHQLGVKTNKVFVTMLSNGRVAVKRVK